MAKLPRIDDETSAATKPEKLVERPQPAPDNYSTSMEHVRRIDVLLPPKHRKIMSDKIRHLQDVGARLEDGTLVTDKTKALLWIIENEVTV
jgi:hypothetical protein